MEIDSTAKFCRNRKQQSVLVGTSRRKAWEEWHFAVVLTKNSEWVPGEEDRINLLTREQSQQRARRAARPWWDTAVSPRGTPQGSLQWRVGSVGLSNHHPPRAEVTFVVTAFCWLHPISKVGIKPSTSEGHTQGPVYVKIFNTGPDTEQSLKKDCKFHI